MMNEFIDMLYHMATTIHIYIYMIPVSGFVPPPPEWVGSTQEKGKKQYVCLCGSLTTRITCIHTYTQTIHTHIHTYRLIHTYIHPYMHVHTDTPPQPTGGGGGKTTCNRPAPPVHIDPCAPRAFGGGVGWGLQTWTIYIIPHTECDP